MADSIVLPLINSMTDIVSVVNHMVSRIIVVIFLLMVLVLLLVDVLLYGRFGLLVLARWLRLRF